MTSKKSKFKNAARACLALCAAAMLLLAGCGGGFGTDSDNANDAAHGIFGKDSTKK